MSLVRFARGSVALFALAAVVALPASSAQARPAYAMKEGLKCE